MSVEIERLRRDIARLEGMVDRLSVLLIASLIYRRDEYEVVALANDIGDYRFPVPQRPGLFAGRHNLDNAIDLAEGLFGDLADAAR